MQKVVVWIVVLVILAAAVYYFTFVYEKANYQHPMRRTSDITTPYNADPQNILEALFNS